MTREIGRMCDGLAHLMARTAFESGTGQRGATPLSEAFLLDHGVRPSMELPLWVPQGREDIAGLDSTNATATG